MSEGLKTSSQKISMFFGDFGFPDHCIFEGIWSTWEFNWVHWIPNFSWRMIWIDCFSLTLLQAKCKSDNLGYDIISEDKIIFVPGTDSTV